LLEARITPQQIADAWRGGGAHALRMAETLTQPELVRIMGSLGGERFGRYASVAGVDGALLGRMTMAIPDATLRIVEPRLTPEGVVRIFNASGAGGIDAVNGAITLEANGRLKGLNDWITFAAGKAPPDLARTVGELPEAQRLAAANPTSIINIGGDQRAPVRADGTAMRSFDITIENPAGAVSRSVEVTTVDAPVAQMGDVTGGVQHAIDKVVSRAADGAPIPGAHDVTIRITLDVGRRPIAGGRVREISGTGEVRIIDADGAFRARRGNPSNLFDDIGGNLGRIGNNANLDRVTIVSAADGTVHAVFDRTAAGWTRVQ
jgi:hypothetical protein